VVSGEGDPRAGARGKSRRLHRFTGKEDDLAVGVTYFGKRYLVPGLGRWASADPLAVHSPGSADLNVYAYVHGYLLRATDPTGLEESESVEQRSQAGGAESRCGPGECGGGMSSPGDAPEPPTRPVSGVKIGAARDGLEQAKGALQRLSDVRPIAGGTAVDGQIGQLRAAISEAESGRDTLRAEQDEGARLRADSDRQRVDAVLAPHLPSTATVPSAVMAPPGSGGPASSVGLLALGAGLASGGGGTTTLYHYTTQTGREGILESMEIFASSGPVHARHGGGQYFTDIAPGQVGGRTLATTPAGQMSLGQLSTRLFGMPYNARRLSDYVEVDAGGLGAREVAPNIFLVEGTTSLNVSGRVVSSGRTLK
jgi:RHS repeat-associated protein